MKDILCFILLVGSIVLGIAIDNLFPFLIAIGVIVYYFIDKSSTEKSLNKSTEEMAQIGFLNSKVSPKQTFIGTNHLSAVGINENTNKIVVLNRKNTKDRFDYRVIDFKDLIEVKLIRDDETVTNTSRAGQIGGAIVGGVIAGGVGAIIGSMGSSQVSHKETKKLSVEMVVDSLEKPIENISFLNEVLALKENDMKYKSAYENANNWYRMLGIIINRNKQENKLS